MHWIRIIFYTVGVFASGTIVVYTLSVAHYDIISTYTNLSFLKLNSSNNVSRNTDDVINSSQPLRMSPSSACRHAISSSHTSYATAGEVMHFAIASCGMSIHRVGVALVKSLFIFSKPDDVIVLHAFVLTDSDVKELANLLHKTFALPGRQMCYAIYRATFPSQTWAKLFRPCASLRLFLPYALPNISRVVYIDTDTIFLRPVVDVWSQFDRFDPQHICGLVREAEEASHGGYDVFKPLNKRPYPPPAGLNSGVFFMHLDRMRQIPWLNSMKQYLRAYKSLIKLGDQDLQNIYFHFHPSAYYRLPCSFNYRSDHCKWNCTDARQHGVAILHANRRILTIDYWKHPIRKIFEVISQANIKEVRFNVTRLFNAIQRSVLVSNKCKMCCRKIELFASGLLSLG